MQLSPSLTLRVTMVSALRRMRNTRTLKGGAAGTSLPRAAYDGKRRLTWSRSMTAVFAFCHLFVVAGAPPQTTERTAVPADNPDTAEFFVSPRGNDEWSGRLADPANNNGPFATVDRARRAVRALLADHRSPRGVRVVLRGGTYFLDAPLEFGPDDSGTEQGPVVYTAAPEERVVISGGRRLPPGRWGEVDGRKAWVIAVPE